MIALAASAAADPVPSLDVTGLTFVASRQNGDALILHALRARIDNTSKQAYLRVVDAHIPARQGQAGFAMRCDSGVVDLESNDFKASGNVTGQAESGEHFATDWVKYDHANGVLYTHAPVLITDEGTTLRGGGFHYDVAERRFRLVGGTQVVQSLAETAENAAAKVATAKAESVP